MSGTYTLERVRQAVSSSLFAWLSVYRVRRGGDLQFDGRRPGEGWHAHGYFRCFRWVFDRGRLVRLTVWKRRWRSAEGRTTHSRPPDDLGLRHCALVVFVELWMWLDGPVGLVRARCLGAPADRRPSTRTVQRWLRALLRASLDVQQRIRETIIERCEPRPAEHLFPGGLPPPESLLRRRWADRPGVEQLWRAIAMLLGGAIALEVAAPVLLAEARGRWRPETSQPLF